MTDPARPEWMGLLARAAPEALAQALPDPLPAHHLLRGPEIGTVMVQGRAGGTGDAFHLGEMTVTRCSLRLADGAVGHAVVQGRDKAHARHAALLDALLTQGHGLGETLLPALRAAEAETARARAAKAAATRVEFFTLVRGEDA